jgi:3'-5' exoribonuclease
MVVRRVEIRGSGAERFTVMTLGNASGVIDTAPFWLGDAPEIAGIARGDAVQVIGEITTYQQRRQLKVSSLRVLPGDSVDWRALMPSVGDTRPYWETIDQWIPAVEPTRLRSAVETFYRDERFRDRFSQCPAALTGPHAMLGGLLKHTVEVAAIARTLGRVMRADVGLTVAGALLHDLGKTEAYTWDGAFALSESGGRLGQAALGSIMLERRLRSPSAPLLTQDEVRELQHIVLVTGSTGVMPRTLAAKAVQLAEAASGEAAVAMNELEDGEALRLFGGPHP